MRGVPALLGSSCVTLGKLLHLSALLPYLQNGVKVHAVSAFSSWRTGGSCDSYFCVPAPARVRLAGERRGRESHRPPALAQAQSVIFDPGGTEDAFCIFPSGWPREETGVSRDPQPARERRQAWEAALAARCTLAAPPPPGWAGPPPGAGPAAGLAGARAAPSHTSFQPGGGRREGGERTAAGRRRLCSASLRALPPAGIMGGPAAADAPEEAGRGSTHRARRDRQAGRRRGARDQCPLGSREGSEGRNENKNTLEGKGARRQRGSGRQLKAGRWSLLAFLPEAPSLPLLPPLPLLPSPLVCWGCCGKTLLLFWYQPGSSVSLASFAGGNKGW